MLKFFKERLLDFMESRPCLDEVPLICLPLVEVGLIYFALTPAKIDMVKAYIDGCKSPRPNEFNFSFYKKFWDVLKLEIYVIFDRFHVNALLPKSLTSFLSLPSQMVIPP